MKDNNIIVEADQISRLYHKADEATRKEMEKIFDIEKILNEKHKVQTFKDACYELGVNPSVEPTVTDLPPRFQRSVLNYYKLLIITEALNDGWFPDFSDPSQKKWWVYSYYNSEHGAACGLAYSDSYSAWSYSYSYIGARLAFKDKETAEYALETFKPLYMELLTNQEPEE
ncbi:MAG: hypothetical protein WC914_02630 [Proteiniphilum sp.]